MESEFIKKKKKCKNRALTSTYLMQYHFKRPKTGVRTSIYYHKSVDAAFYLSGNFDKIVLKVKTKKHLMHQNLWNSISRILLVTGKKIMPECYKCFIFT